MPVAFVIPQSGLEGMPKALHDAVMAACRAQLADFKVPREIRHASKLVYAAGMDLEKAEGTPIGVNCRLCERENCSQRAEPPITRTLILDENTRRVSSFAFSNAREL